ncbi:hypothetical protein [Xanthobacter wiegelii]|uniref:hypothetical protein n=1 Tax=Xanthobacter wiegelii TaxID=3119913 RepID=UPI00372C7C6F
MKILPLKLAFFPFFAIGLSVLLWLHSTQNAIAAEHAFKLDHVALMVVNGSRSGVPWTRYGAQAHIIAWPSVTVAEMEAYAAELQKSTLEKLANENNGDLTFMTFYLEKSLINGQNGWKTFRIGYVKRNDGSWIEDHKPDKSNI